VTIVNSRGMVADYAPTSQFWPNETEFACGFYAGALNKYAGLPGAGPTGTPDQVRRFAEEQYIAVYGSDAANQDGGISIPQLHQVLHVAGLHYWDLPIDAGTQRTSDVARVKAALNAGYPVIATVVEASVRDLTGDLPAGSPYEWTPAGTHVITYVGIASNGNLLAVDPANVVGPLQGSNHTRPWPRVYDAGSIDMTYACVVQLVGPDPARPWLAPIPGGDPLAWPAGFNAQQFERRSWVSASQKIQAEDYWNATTAGEIPVGGNAPVTAGIFPAGHAPSYQTGIAQSWQSEYQAGHVWGPPLSYEFASVTWDGKAIVAQMFAGGRCEWDGSAHWYPWQ